MPKVALYNMKGEIIGDVELSDSVFGIAPNEAAMHSFVKMQLANKRVGNSSTKTRAEVRGGGKKPWRQKGTGRARVGSSRNPLWRGGGVAFGPKPRSYAYSLPKKIRRLAMTSALSSKVLSQEITVIDELKFDEPKTRWMVETLNAFETGNKILVVTAGTNIEVYKSARNIAGVKPVKADFMSVYDILNCETLIMTKAAVEYVEEVYA